MAIQTGDDYPQNLAQPRVGAIVPLSDQRRMEAAVALTAPQRYCLVQDQDGCFYVVPVNKLADWSAWLALPADVEAASRPPAFAQSLGEDPCGAWFTFEDPRVKP